MVEETTDLLAQFDPTSQKPREPDYIFVASSGRKSVLFDQLTSLGFKTEEEIKADKEKKIVHKGGMFKEYKYTFEPEDKVLVLVFFDDSTLNKEAEEQNLMIQLQDKYQTLPFKDAGRSLYQRFKSTERYRLMQSKFKKEFNVRTLIEGGVVFEHFMPHSSKKYEIIESLDKHVLKLIWNNLSMTESFRKHFEPINLIADYYGEKYALYLAFILHHIGWILVPAVVGGALWVY